MDKEKIHEMLNIWDSGKRKKKKILPQMRKKKKVLSQIRKKTSIY